MKSKRQRGKGEVLIYIVIVLWIIFGIIAIKYGSNLPQVAGYYTSLTLFVSTYLWGEYKRADTKTTIFKKGPNSSREIVIYITVLLWTILGLFGIIKNMNINNLTVYFSALSPFVTSYIIYKTAKGDPLPIFNGDAQSMVDKSKTTVNQIPQPITQNLVSQIIQPVINQSVEKIEPVLKKDVKNEDIG